MLNIKIQVEQVAQSSQALETATKASEHGHHAHSRIDTLFKRFAYCNSTLAAAFSAWCRDWAGEGADGDTGGAGAELAGEMQDGEP